jgi:hypothetical protein
MAKSACSRHLVRFLFDCTLVRLLLIDSVEGRFMSATMSTSASLCWCQLPVPQELETEVLCVQHFLTTVEHDCSDLRREIAVGKTTPARQAEIADWVKTTANKLTIVAYGRLRLSDEFKKRILTTFLTLMNLHESLDRSANRATTIRPNRELPVV